MKHPRLLYVRTAKTASSAVTDWCRARNIMTTNNQKWILNPENQKILTSRSVYFTTVRNPYRRAFSQYKYWKRGGWRPIIKTDTFLDFLNYDMEKNLSDRYPHEKSHMTPVYYYLKDILHQIKYIFKVEELDKELPKLIEEFGLSKHAKLPIVYETHYYKPQMDEAYKSKEIRDLVYERYKDDFINFNYDKDDYKNLYPEKL